MPRTLSPVGKIQFTVRVTEPAAKALTAIAIAEGGDRAAIAARILEIAKHIQPEEFLEALAAFQKAARKAG